MSSSDDFVSSSGDDYDSDDFESEPETKKKRAKKAPAEKPGNKKKTTEKAPAKPKKAKDATPKSVSNVSDVTAGKSHIPAPMMEPGSEDIRQLTTGDDITTESAAKKLILQYFTIQNRPYSAIQIMDNFHKRIGKSLVDKALASLSEGGGIICKEYGKTKIFYLDQATLPSEITPEQMNSLESEVESLKERVDGLVQEEKCFQHELNRLLSEPADEEIDGVIASMESRIQDMQMRANAVSESDVDTNMVESVIRAHNNLRNMWKCRKEQCMEVVDAISDGSSKKLKDILADMGIETDEDARVSMPLPCADLKKR